MPPPSDRRSQVATGAAWMLAARFAERGLGLLSIAILARLLSPADFGLVALATAMIAALEVLSALGVDWALIQHAAPERRHFDTAWTLKLLLGGAVFILVCAAAFPAAEFFREPRLVAVMMALAASGLVSAGDNVGMVYFRRELKFGPEFLQRFTVKLVGIGVSIPIAWYLRSYWALIAGVLASRIWQVALSYRLHDFRPRLSLEAARELLSFSVWLQLNGMLEMIKARLPDWLLGRQFGVRTVGVYSVSFELAHLSTTALAAPINRAVFSGYAQVSQDPHALRAGYLTVASVIWLVALPAAVGIAVMAPQIVGLVLGSQWLDAVPVLRILAYAGVVAVAASNMNYVYLALGRPRVMTALGALWVCLLIPAMLIGSAISGVAGVATGYLVTALVMLPANFVVLARMVDISAKSWLQGIWRPATASAIMAACVRVFGDHLESAYAASLGLQAAAMVAIGIASYVLAVWLFWLLSGTPRGAESTLLEVIRRRSRGNGGAGYPSDLSRR